MGVAERRAPRCDAAGPVRAGPMPSLAACLAVAVVGGCGGPAPTGTPPVWQAVCLAGNVPTPVERLPEFVRHATHTPVTGGPVVYAFLPQLGYGGYRDADGSWVFKQPFVFMSTGRIRVSAERGDLRTTVGRVESPGRWVVPSLLTFPSPGCWRVTAWGHDRSVRFTISVGE